MTGHDIADLRRTLGLTREDVSELLGVGHTTPSRWEAAGGDEVALDPRNRELLELVADLVRRRSPEQASALGRRLRLAIEHRGGIYALHRLLAIAHVDEFDVERPPARTPARSAR